MKIRTVKKVVKEFFIKGRKIPPARRVRLDNVRFLEENGDRRKSKSTPKE